MQGRPRIRDTGLVTGSLPTGLYNAITDVPGVKVGHVTLVEGSGKLSPGRGPVRTGVTVILPHAGNLFLDKVPAAVHTINGYGKATGFEQVRELGELETPVALTSTLNVGRVWDALVSWAIRNNPPGRVQSLNPVVGECNDSYLNDIQGRHVSEQDVFLALEGASGGPVEEGAVGAGTGMTCYEFKGGIGSASRVADGYTTGALVLTNFGARPQLSITGAPVGKILAERERAAREEEGSVMIVIATDAPVDSRQLGRMARRAGMGLARTGSTIGHGSGDFAIAFSSARQVTGNPDSPILRTERLVDAMLGIHFQAVIEAVEEAVYNSLFRAETVVGRDGHTSPALPLEETVKILQQYGHPEAHL